MTNITRDSVGNVIFASMTAIFQSSEDPEKFFDARDLYEEAGMDSLDAVENIIALEEAYNIQIPDELVNEVEPKNLDDYLRIVQETIRGPRP
jgi:acyl carrier protein